MQSAQLLAMARQIKALATSPPDGVRYVPGDALTEVLADVDGPVGTPYEGGVFRVKLVLGSDFPSAPPKGFFLTKIFHPNVSATGDICVNTLKKDWKPEHTLAHVLQVVSCLLIVPFPESSLNDEAGKLFMESYDEYARKARLWTGIHALGGTKPAPRAVEGEAGAGAGAGGAGAGAGAGVGSDAPADTGAAAASAVAPPRTLTTAKGNNVEVPVAGVAGNAVLEKRKAVGAGAGNAEAEGQKKRALKRL